MHRHSLTKRQYLEMEKLALGAFKPLDAFMGRDDFGSVVKTMRLRSGDVFPLPVVLDVDVAFARCVRSGDNVELAFGGEPVGTLTVTDAFTCDKTDVARRVYGTDDRAHPGVAHFLALQSHFLGGHVQLTRRARFEYSHVELTPAETRARFAELGWKTVVGFQTRNVPHRAHEYLQRTGLEHCDGLFVQPLVGYKKRGDYNPLAIIAGYQALFAHCFPPSRAVLGVLSTSMRYAGPREAVFHAIIRRNYGCTHFIVGRDHAGVGSYYRKYEAQELAKSFDAELGIEILALCGPFYCRLCDGIATEKTCRHYAERPDVTHEISGTEMRRLLGGQAEPAPTLMRPEVVAAVSGMSLFVEADE